MAFVSKFKEVYSNAHPLSEMGRVTYISPTHVSIPIEHIRCKGTVIWEINSLMLGQVISTLSPMVSCVAYKCAKLALGMSPSYLLFTLFSFGNKLALPFDSFLKF